MNVGSRGRTWRYRKAGTGPETAVRGDDLNFPMADAPRFRPTTRHDFGAEAIASVGYCGVGVPSQHSDMVFASPVRARATSSQTAEVNHELVGSGLDRVCVRLRQRDARLGSPHFPSRPSPERGFDGYREAGGRPDGDARGSRPWSPDCLGKGFFRPAQ